MTRSKTTRTRQLTVLTCILTTLFLVTGCGGGGSGGTEGVSAPGNAGISATAGRNPANVINSAIASAVEITIDVGAGAVAGETLSVTLSDGVNQSMSAAVPTAAGGGSVIVGPIDASALADGAIEVDVHVALGALSETTSFGAILSKDTVAPVLPTAAIIPEGEQDAPNPQGVVNTNNQSMVTVQVSFDASASASDLLSVILSDGVNSVETTQQNAAPSGQNHFTGIDASSLTDGLITYTVQMVDGSDNFSTWQGNAEKDTAVASINSAWVASSAMNAQDVVNQATAGSVTIQLELGDEGATTDLVTVTCWSDADDSHRVTSEPQMAVEGGGTMLFGGFDLSDLSDGILTCEVSIVDINLNSYTAAGDPGTLDTTLASPVSVGVPAGASNAANVVNTFNAANAVVEVQFGAAFAAAGDTLEVFIDHAGGTLSSGPITMLGDENFSSVTFDLTGIAEGTLVTRTMSTDQAGNTFEGGGFNLTHDVTPPAGHNVAQVAMSAGNPISTVIQVNDAAAVIEVDVQADTDAERTIQIEITDGATTVSSAVESAQTSGGFMQFAPMDLSGLQEGPLAITATYTDAAGNTMVQNGTAALHDVSVPMPSTGSVSAGSSNAANTVNASNVGAVNTTIALPAATTNTDVYSLSFKAPGQVLDFPALNGPDGGGVLTFPSMDVSTLPDGMITMSVVATDMFGNQTSWAGPNIQKDTAAPGAPATAFVLSGATNAVNEINASNASATSARVQMSATSGVDETVSVTLRDSGGASVISATQLTNGPGGFIDFFGMNCSGLVDGNIEVVVDITDAAGNASTFVVASATKATQAVMPTSAQVVAGTSNAADIINQSNAGSVQVDVTMPAAAFASDMVEVTLSAGGSAMSGQQAAPAGGGVMSFFVDASALTDGNVTVQVDVVAANTNTSTFVGTAALMDTVAPTTPTSAIVPSGNDWPTNAVNAMNASSVYFEMAWPTSSDAADQVTFEMTDGAASVTSGTFSPMPGTTQGYTHDLSALADGPITLNISMSDAVGNTVVWVGSPVTKDVVAPVAPTAGGIGAGAGNAADIINISNAAAAGVELTWPAGAEATDYFTVTIVDSLGASLVSNTMNPTPGASSWTFFDTTAMADGPFSFKVDMTDPAGNQSPFSPNPASKDTVAPAASISQTVALGGSNPANWINAASAGAVMVDVTFGAGSLSSETATVWIGSSAPTPTQAQSTPAGAGTLSFGPFDASAMADGSVKIFVDVTDAAGNIAQTFGGATKDTTAPTTPTSMIIPAAQDQPANYINIASQAAVLVHVAWPTGADASDQVVLDMTDGVATVTAPSFSPMPGTTQGYTYDLSSLADGAITMSMVLTDTAGNTSAYIGSPVTKDVVAPAIPTSGGIGAGAGNAADFINISSVTAAGMELFWPASAVATDYFTITMVDSLGASMVSGNLNPTPGSSSWTAFDTTSLADGPVTFKVDMTDPAGNQSPFSPNAAAKDTVAPAAAVSQVVALGGSNPSGVINISSESAVTVDVTFDALSLATETASVWLDDGAQQSATLASSATAGSGVISFGPFNAAALSDGSVKVFVNITDAAGNATSTFNTATKDSTIVASSQTTIPATAGNNANTISAATASTVSVDVTFPASADGTENATIDLTGGATVTSTSQAIPAGGGVVTFAGLNASGLTDGAINITVNVTDANQNAASTMTLTATMDTAAPAVPTAAVVAATVNNPQDFINASTAASVTVDLTFPAGSNADDLATVTLSDGVQNAISAPVNAPAGGGTIQVFGLNTSAFADGAVTVQVDMVDQSLNTSGPFAGTPATQDVVVPADPTVDPITTPTNQAAQTITGVADASTSIVIDGGAVQATGTSDVAGAFAVSTTLAASATNSLTVYAEDAAGNRSPGQTLDYNTVILSIVQNPAAADAPFTDATATYLPVNSNGAADGGAFADFDGDGDLDLFVASAASGILYQYDSVAGQFNDISVSAGGPFIGDVCAVWGDYDNDGDLDLLTVDATIGSTLYRNDIIGLGSTTFTDVTVAELAGVTGTVSQAFWLDYDNDGFLDFLVINSDGAGNYLMQNQRGQVVPTNAFVRASAAGIDSAGTSKFWGAVCDFDVDGDQDVVYGGATPGYFWQNSGAATFADIAGVTSNVTWDHSTGGRGTAWVDYDNDGDFDLYISRGAAGPVNQMWRNDGGGVFTEVAALAGLDTDVDADDICWGDVNNDGFIDLYVGSNVANRLYLGLGDTNADNVFEFSEVSVASGVGDAGDAGMVQMGDVDGDGDLEVFVGNEGAFDVLFDNDLNNFNYLRVNVAGQGIGAGTSSADGRGAVVTLKDATGTITLATREINGGRGAGSQDAEHCHFGGVIPSLSYTVEVRFPSGAVATQIVTPRFLANHTVTISE